MIKYIETVLRFRAWVIGLTILITLGAGGVISTAVLGSSMLKLFFGNNPAYDLYIELSEQFGATDGLIIAFEDPELFTPKGLARLERITKKIEAVPEVRAVESVVGAQRVRGENDDLVVESYFELAQTSTGAALEIRAELSKDPDLGAFLVSRDGRAATIVAELTNDTDRQVESIPLIMDAVVQPLLDEGFAREDLHLAGLGPESASATQVALETIVELFPLTLFLLTAAVFMLFRRVWPVFVTMSVAFVSITWAVAFAVILDPQINLLIAAVPAVMVTVAFSDIIHLCSTYLLAIENGAEKLPAIIKSGSEVGLACVWTSLTTFFGFISLSFVPTPVFQQVGAVLAFGVAVALLLALTLVPIFLFYLPVPTGHGRETRRSGQFVAWVCASCLRVSTQFPKITSAAFVLLTAGSAYGVFQIHVETTFLDRLDRDHPMNVARRFIQERFVGTNSVDLYVELEQGSILERPDLLAKMATLQDQLNADPAVDRTISFITVLEKIESALGFDARDRTRQSVAQSLLLFEMADGGGIDRVLSPDGKTARFAIRLGTLGLVETGKFGHRAAELATTTLGDEVKVTPTGLTFLFGEWIEFIVQGQKRGLGFAVLATLLLMIIGLRGFRVGLLSMVPNLLPILVLGGYVGLFWDAVDSDTILVAMVGIGIAVDDTIHFLTRLRIESRTAETPRQALERTFYFTGSALVQTSIILCLGFLPFAMSEYFSTRILGTLLPLTLIVALFADLLLLPALVQLGIIRFPRR